MVLVKGLVGLIAVLGLAGVGYFLNKKPNEDVDPRVSMVVTSAFASLNLGDLQYDQARARMEVKAWDLPPLAGSTSNDGPPRIAVLAWGSRGDMQPVVALALGLQGAGLAVRLHVRPLEVDFVRSFNLDVVADLEDDPDASKCILSDGKPIRHLYESIRAYRPKLILYSLTTAGEAWILGEQLGIQTMFYNLQPPPNQPELWRSRLSAVRMHFDIGLGTRTLRGLTDAEGLERLSGNRPRLLAYSKELFYTPPPHWSQLIPGVPPPPKDVHDPIGHWLIKPEEQEKLFQSASVFFGGKQEAEVTKFLAAGSPPVYIGWGSMETEAKAMAALAVSALKKAGRRGIILGGSAGLRRDLLDGQQDLLGYADANVLWLRWAPHEWLLPQCSLAVHHGGAGTIAAVHRAGIPSVVTPVSLDQFLWGPAVAEKGVGVSAEKLETLKVDELAEAILKCEADSVRAAAAELGEKMRQEDGVAKAVEIISEVLKTSGQ